MVIPMTSGSESTPTNNAEPFDANRRFEIVGLIPAAGHARRLGLSTGSKELLPVVQPFVAQPPSNADTPDSNNASVDNTPKPAAAFLLKQMADAGCQRAIFILRAGKWDIAQAFGTGENSGIPLAYVTIEDSWGPPFTLRQAFPFLADAGAATGFPDILIEPPDAMAQIINRLRHSDAQVVLATFPASREDDCDLAIAQATGKITKIAPKETDPPWNAGSRTWLLAAWRPTFTDFFQKTLSRFATEMACLPTTAKRDLPMGALFSAALEAGLAIDSVHFPAGRFLDIGTPERFARADTFFSTPS